MFSQHSVRGDLTPNGLEPKCLLKFALRYRNPTPDGETLTKKPEPCSNIHCVSSKHMRCTSKALTKLQRFLPSQWLPFGASEEEALRKPFPGFFFDRVFFFVPLCGFLKKSHFGDRPLQPQITLRDDNTRVPRHRRSRSRLPLHHHQGRRRRLIDGTRR